MTEIFGKWDTETINRLQNFLLLFWILLFHKNSG
jgi:hypothetical protein